MTSPSFYPFLTTPTASDGPYVFKYFSFLTIYLCSGSNEQQEVFVSLAFFQLKLLFECRMKKTLFPLCLEMEYFCGGFPVIQINISLLKLTKDNGVGKRRRHAKHFKLFNTIQFHSEQ